MTQPSTGGISLAQVRQQIAELLQRLARNAMTSGREIAIDVVCDSIEALPVPVLSKVLARTVRKTFGPSGPRGGGDVREVLDLLERMQASDQELRYSLESLGLDLDQIQADMEAIQADTSAIRGLLTRPELRMHNPDVQYRWPVFDHRVSFLLANVGGGAVVVDEIYAVVEAWEPVAAVDYSVPAAPLGELHLRCELSTDMAEYALLKLNGEPARIFNERGTGAERVVIDFAASQNVRYSLRLRIARSDLVTGEAGVLEFPAAGEPPLSLTFAFAPGWHRWPAESVLARRAVMEDMAARFRGITALLTRTEALPEEERRRLVFEGTAQIGIPEYVLGPWLFGYFLNSFVPPFAGLARLERRQDLLAVALDLLAARFRDPNQAYDPSAEVIDALKALANNLALKPALRDFIGAADPKAQEEMRAAILARVVPLG